jgi:hypothetical protein
VLTTVPFLDVPIKLANVLARLRHSDIDREMQASTRVRTLYRRKSNHKWLPDAEQYFLSYTGA